MSMYYLELTYEGAKIGDDTPSIIITTTIPVKLPVAAHVLREGAQNRYTQDVLWSLAEVQGIDPETVKLRSATLDRRFHPSLSEEDVIQKAKGYLIAESDYGGGALHIQRDGDVCLFADDAAAAAAAEADGVKLIKDLPLGPGDKDFAFYVDTPENRRRLGEYLAWERRISWDGFSGDRMYIRIGNNEMDMGAAISMLAEAMGVKDPVAAIDVAIGRRVPAGKIEAVMDYTQSASPSDEKYPAIDIQLRPADGSGPIQMALVEQNIIDRKNPAACLYHRNGKVVVRMEMPFINDDDAAKTDRCEAELHIFDGDKDKKYPIRVIRGCSR